MVAARPTTLRLYTDYCGKAVDHYEDGAHQDRRVFATGTAAHDVLHTIALFGVDKAAITDTVEKLLTVGRAGVDAEPPLPVDAVFVGRDLALGYAEGGTVPRDGRPELGLAFDDKWQPCAYEAENAWFRTRLDMGFAVENEDGETGIVVRDYKTSWSADESLLGSIQMRAQAVAAVAHYTAFGLDAPPMFVRREIVNLRSRRSWGEDLFLDAEGEQTLEKWADDLRTVTKAMEQRPRIARPGLNCIGCSYASSCDAASELAQKVALTPEQIASAYAAAQARADELKEAARDACDGGAIETPDGTVGYMILLKRVPKANVGTTLWSDWTKGKTVDPGTAQLARGLLTAIDWGVGTVTSVAKAMFPSRKEAAARRAYVDQQMGEALQRRFGIIRAKPVEITENTKTFTEEDEV